MVEEKKECSGQEYSAGFYSEIHDCASSCKGKSSMFIFGTNEFGNNRCNMPGKPTGCACICEVAASGYGTCDTIGHTGYNLYKYSKGNSNVFYYLVLLPN